MTLRIERLPDGATITIRLIGRIQAEHLEELRRQITRTETTHVLDLDEVSLVDLEVVRFLGECQDEGISLVHCSPYITDWIATERGRDSRSSES